MELNYTFVLAWLCMMTAIFAASSIGPVFKYMESHHITPCLSASWRCQCMVIFLLPLAILESRWKKDTSTETNTSEVNKDDNNNTSNNNSNSIEWLARKPDLQYPLFIHILFAGFAWAGNLLCWIIALQYASTVQASILTSTHPLMLVIYYQISKTTIVSLYEWIGVGTVLLGIICAALHKVIHQVLYDLFLVTMSFSHHPSSSTSTSTSLQDTITTVPSHLDTDDLIKDIPWQYELLSIILCLGSSMCEVVVLLNRSKIKKYVPLMQYTAVTTLIVMLSATIMAYLLEGGLTGELHIWCTDIHCIFGWTSPEWVLKMLLFGFVIGLVCMTGFNYAIAHIPALIFSSVTLIDPLVTGLLSWAAGLEHVPDIGTWIGGIIVIFGVCLITYGERSRQHSEAVVEGQDDMETLTNKASGLYELVPMHSDNNQSRPLSNHIHVDIHIKDDCDRPLLAQILRREECEEEREALLQRLSSHPDNNNSSSSSSSSSSRGRPVLSPRHHMSPEDQSIISSQEHVTLLLLSDDSSNDSVEHDRLYETDYADDCQDDRCVRNTDKTSLPLSSSSYSSSSSSSICNSNKENPSNYSPNHQYMCTTKSAVSIPLISQVKHLLNKSTIISSSPHTHTYTPINQLNSVRMIDTTADNNRQIRERGGEKEV